MNVAPITYSATLSDTRIKFSAFAGGYECVRFPEHLNLAVSGVAKCYTSAI